ncbi:hypothetical protein [Indioceanicola profundi]|uniref:hypothetical protein n=1 Tax=Indioceanicola profundi TaxID=2220096 RepID=UPI0013C52C73|nr:hypothetical protein [Indioceanicola profundi]
MAAGNDPNSTPGNMPNGGEPSADELRIRRQAERIREMERLMRAAAAFARGKPGR